MSGTGKIRGRVPPALELLAACLILLWAHIRLDVPANRIPDYGRPDSLFYTIGGVNLARGRGYEIIVNEKPLPPKFPPGTSLLLSLWYLAAGGDRASGTSAIQGLALVLGLGVWLLARRRAGPAGGLAALLALEAGLCLASLRNQAVSEVPAALLVLGVMALAASPRPGRRRIALAGLLAGFGPWIRYPLVLLLPAPILALKPWRREGRARGALLLLWAALPAVLLLAWQTEAFGSPFRTGYGLWLPGYHQGDRALFSLSYAFHGPAEGLPGEPNLPYYLKLLAGEGALLLPWPQALASLAGAVLLLLPGRRDSSSTAVFTLTCLLGFLSLFGFYFYQEARLLAPLAPILAVLGSLGGKALGLRIQGGPPPARRILRHAPLLLLLAGNGWFFWRITTAIPWESIRLDQETRHAEKLEAALPRDSILVTERDILLLSHELPGRTILPLSPRQEWVEALLYMDWREKTPRGGDYSDFRRWMAGLEARPPGGIPGKDFIVLPGRAALPFLEEAVKEGRRVFFDISPPRRLPPWASAFRLEEAGGLYRAVSLR